MYNQYIPGDLLYSRLYKYDQPQEAEVLAAVEETASQTADATDTPQQIQAPTRGETQKNAGITGILEGLGLGSLGGNSLLLLAFLLLFFGKGSKSILSPALLSLLFLLLGTDEVS